MTDIDREIENFFTQDLVSADCASFAVGQVWFYFYRETLIGVRDLDTDEGYFLNAKTKLPDNGFSSQHLITEKIVEEAVNEGVSNTPVKYMEMTELSRKALAMGLKSFSEISDKMIMGG